AVLVVTLVLTAKYADYLAMRVQQSWIVSAIRRRGNAHVDPDDADAFYVGLIPRKNWGKIMAENAEDIGYAKIDPLRRVLLFEGDRQRWTIPAASIEACEMAEFCVGPVGPDDGNVFAVAVLKANVGGRVWEAPLAAGKVVPQRRTGKM